MNPVNEKTTISFTCSMCQRTLSVPEKSVVTGSTRLPNGFLICYDCAGKWDAASMIDTGLFIGYLDSNTIGETTWTEWTVTNYPGTLVFKCTQSPNKSKHNIGGVRNDVWFTGPDGAQWHGVNIGNNMILRCKRLKKQKKVLTPLKEETYLKPYAY